MINVLKFNLTFIKVNTIMIKLFIIAMYSRFNFFPSSIILGPCYFLLILKSSRFYLPNIW